MSLKKQTVSGITTLLQCTFTPLYRNTPLYRHLARENDTHLVITDSLLYPWEKKARPFSLKSTRLICTPR